LPPWLEVPVLKLLWLAVSAMSFAAIADAQDAQILLQKYKCYICHADAESRTGPAYADVAAMYRGKPKALASLAAAIRRGVRGGGPWHMPPHPEISDDDARKMARYILSLKK
jgi:cytochrome c